MPKWMVVLLPVILVGCASPSDIQNLHDAEILKYQSDLSAAQQWGTHTLGIPASGWMAIIITSIVLGCILLVCAGVWAYNVQERRASNAMVSKRMYSEERKAIAARPTCGMCGYTLTPTGIAEEMSKNARVDD